MHSFCVHGVGDKTQDLVDASKCSTIELQPSPGTALKRQGKDWFENAPALFVFSELLDGC
jgi:hypothetical protein